MNEPSATSPSRLLAYLQLMRLPNVFTAMADVAMGFLFTHETVEPLGVFALLLVSSSCLYTAGMVLNDVSDFGEDLQLRPSRPLPSGRVSFARAKSLFWLLLGVGQLTAFGAAAFADDERTLIVLVALVVLIVAYDKVLKHTPLGPLTMGGCRMLNVLLGMSASPEAWTGVNWTIAAGIGLYITGVTWFARSEATSSHRLHLTGALLVMLAGMAVLWWFPQIMPREILTPMLQVQPRNWTVLWVLLGLIIGWRSLRAILQPEAALVQAAVKTGILSIIVLDAVLVFAVRGPMASIAILLLLVPTIILGWWVYST